MHVISSECTADELCLAPCPIDCIMQPSPQNNGAESLMQKSTQAKWRYDACCLRKEKEIAEKAERTKKAGIINHGVDKIST